MKEGSIADDLFLSVLLRKRKEAGYVRIGIANDSITGEPGKKKEDGRIKGWPAIWRIVENDLKLPRGAGNSNQMQVFWYKVKEINHVNIMGVYKLNKEGTWDREEGKRAGYCSVEETDYDREKRR